MLLLLLHESLALNTVAVIVVVVMVVSIELAALEPGLLLSFSSWPPPSSLPGTSPTGTSTSTSLPYLVVSLGPGLRLSSPSWPPPSSSSGSSFARSCRRLLPDPHPPVVVIVERVVVELSSSSSSSSSCRLTLNPNP